MINPKEALKLIKDTATRLNPAILEIGSAVSCVLAADTFATTDLPPFTQSSVDGYAFKYEANLRAYRVIAAIAAGPAVQFSLPQGTAARIFTGAPLPEGSDTVVMQEYTMQDNDQLSIIDPNISKGANVRLKGMEIQNGAIAIPAGTVLSPAAVGYLAGIGLDAVLAIPPPKITVIITGNELQKPGLPLAFGQIYESNGVMLKAALNQVGIHEIEIVNAVDDLAPLTATLDAALKQSDMVLLTGGVSVGDYDFVPKAALTCGVEQVFHKIRQKPGKPLFFGKKGRQLLFGLPGNPSSVLNCFYLYVLPALGILWGKQLMLRTETATLTDACKKNTQLTHFMKGQFQNGRVTLSHAQESFRLSSFVAANCLVELPEEQLLFAGGDRVTIHLLPDY